VREIAAVDLDGDGLLDLAALSVTGHASGAVHHLSVYWQRSENSFPEQPDAVWDLDRRIVLLDLSVDGEPAGGPAAKIDGSAFFAFSSFQVWGAAVLGQYQERYNW